MSNKLANKESTTADLATNTIEGSFEEIENWRIATEAKHCLEFYSLDERRRFLKAIEKYRGEVGRKLLEAAMLKEWNARKNIKNNAPK